MYEYNVERPKLFTEEGQVLFLKIRDNVNRLIEQAGAVRMDRAISGCSGDSWQMLACVDRMVELKEITESSIPNCAGQYRIFTKFTGR